MSQQNKPNLKFINFAHYCLCIAFISIIIVLLSISPIFLYFYITDQETCNNNEYECTILREKDCFIYFEDPNINICKVNCPQKNITTINCYLIPSCNLKRDCCLKINCKDSDYNGANRFTLIIALLGILFCWLLPIGIIIYYHKNKIQKMILNK